MCWPVFGFTYKVKEYLESLAHFCIRSRARRASSSTALRFSFSSSSSRRASIKSTPSNRSTPMERFSFGENNSYCRLFLPGSSLILIESRSKASRWISSSDILTGLNELPVSFLVRNSNRLVSDCVFLVAKQSCLLALNAGAIIASR